MAEKYVPEVSSTTLPAFIIIKRKITGHIVWLSILRRQDKISLNGNLSLLPGRAK